MRSVNVIPITGGVGKETLTYFTAKDVECGSLVTVPLRKKVADAIVVSVKDIALSKTQIKSADYTLKKVSGVKAHTFFLPAFIEAAKKTARYHASWTGAVINSLIPRNILKDFAGSLKTTATQTTSESHEKSKGEKFVFQADEEERIASYKSLVREEFAKGNSLFICVPTIQNIERIVPFLERGISKYVYVLHGELSKKELLKAWVGALEEEHPIVVVGTGFFLSLPRPDIKTVIIEKESSSAYKTQRRPFLDIRTFANFFSSEINARFIAGDTLLRAETLYEKDRGNLLEFSPLKFRSLSSAQSSIVDMNVEGHNRQGKFIIISDELKTLIGHTQKHNERMFVFVSRRGLAPITMCGDCGHIIMCGQCSAPLVLHGKGHRTSDDGAKNIFTCHKCFVKQEPTDICKACDSWRLTSLGIGSELVEEEIKKLSFEGTVLRLDKDTAHSKKRMLDILDRFYAAPSSILIGTEMAVPYLKKIANAGIVSIDSLFALPDFRINERIFGLLLHIRAKTVKKFLIQTRIKDEALFEHVTQGNMLAFYREEIEDRKKLRYPPTVILIKISVTGTKQKTSENMLAVEQLLEAYNPDIFPAFTSKIRGRYTQHALIRVDSTAWPDNNLLRLLYSLPPSFAINVNPESIL